jgi:acyl-CoA reductase-like NAD-dependent aldehyde dehydrogenase
MSRGENTMKPDGAPAGKKRWTAAELRRLPPEQRDAILEEAAALAEEEYRNNLELTAFEAFGKDDLYGDSSSAEAR